ncbi:MAG: hypothetical protein M0R33_08200 [Methylomonas sp.]|uniref:hypothetical protein n=1 Tax=Methylomonas sp. TaxID=418 RepID=UPI0025D6D9BA|nr:hypothetical protein [Methylomonas sp.]MCK9606420.1 hypothetical protein [Methylomonas sp.]
MATLTPFLFPLLANLWGIYLVLRQKRPAIFSVLLTNLAGSLLFGLSVSIRVWCCATDTDWWLMPLLLAPLEYWQRFGIAIISLSALLAGWSKIRKTRKHLSSSLRP